MKTPGRFLTAIGTAFSLTTKGIFKGFFINKVFIGLCFESKYISYIYHIPHIGDCQDIFILMFLVSCCILNHAYRKTENPHNP